MFTVTKSYGIKYTLYHEMKINVWKWHISIRGFSKQPYHCIYLFLIYATGQVHEILEISKICRGFIWLLKTNESYNVGKAMLFCKVVRWWVIMYVMKLWENEGKMMSLCKIENAKVYISTTTVRLILTRSMSNGLAIHRLNHLAILSCVFFKKSNIY